MKSTQTQSAIVLLKNLANKEVINAAEIDEAIDILESIKQVLNADDEESVDTIDETQDYLQYVQAVNDLPMEEIRIELGRIIQELEKNSR